jgi:Protein of unknown function (DUF3306)
MTDEDFLSRWSRRKREVAKAETAPREEAKPASAELQPHAAQTAEPEFDIASLPPIESINALTDVTAFLRAGVPSELTRAALRRVWTADPAIRDFVGLAENAWDFTDPNAMPGFGPLELTDDVRRMVANIVNQIGEVAHVSPPPSSQTASDSNTLIENRPDDQPGHIIADSSAPGESAHEPSDSQVLLQSSRVDAAPQRDAAEAEEALPKSSRRLHGGALPQ